MSEQLESREAELEEARDRVESLVSDLGRQQVAHSSALEELQRELAAEHTERMAEIERRVNEARREQTKAGNIQNKQTKYLSKYLYKVQ